MADHSLQFPVNIVTLPARGSKIVLEPDQAERQLLAEKAGAVSVDWFKADLVFKRWHKNGVSVDGEVRAGITQECVVTLEPLETLVAEKIERLFVPDGSKLMRPELNQDGEWVLDPEGPDIPDPFTGDSLDAWEIVLEHFLLGIDPFVRKEGVAFEDATAQSDDEVEEKENPFAALKGLLKDDGDTK